MIRKKAKGPVNQRSDSRIAGQLKYQKITGGIHRMADGRTILKDQTFFAFPDEIPKLFMSSFKCLDSLEYVEKVETPAVKVGIKPAGKGKWNVVNTLTGDILNDVPLSAKDAKSFLEDGKKDLPDLPDHVKVGPTDTPDDEFDEE